jgi:hypothetical protein
MSIQFILIFSIHFFLSKHWEMRRTSKNVHINFVGFFQIIHFFVVLLLFFCSGHFFFAEKVYHAIKWNTKLQIQLKYYITYFSDDRLPIHASNVYRPTSAPDLMMVKLNPLTRAMSHAAEAVSSRYTNVCTLHSCFHFQNSPHYRNSEKQI